MDARLNISFGLTAPAAGRGMPRRRLWAGVAALVIGLFLAAFCAAPALAAAGDISTVAGNGTSGYSGDGGPATSAALTAPVGVAFSGSDLRIADFYAHTVRGVNSGGTISTLAGTGTAGYSGDGGPAASARLNQPGDVVTDAAGNLYIADFNNSRVRKVTPGGTISSYAGTGTYGYSGDSGPAMAARLGNPAGLDVDAAGNLYVADFNSTVRKITPAGIITTVAGTGVAGYSGDGGPATSARLNQAGDAAVDGAGNVYIGEWAGHRVRKVTPGGTISTVAGTGTAGYSGTGGPATAAQLNNPGGVDIDSSGNLFIAEYSNHVIRRVNSAGTITRVAGTATAGFSGDGGPATSARLYNPARVVLAANGDFYITDWSNHRVRKVAGLGSPNAPTFTSTSPASPSPSNNPSVIGSATAGSTVTLYTNSTCTSAVAASGTAAQLASPGLAVSVANDSTTTFWGTVTDSGGSVSGCSTSSITYVEDSTPPSVPSIDSAPSTPGNDSTPTWSFSGAGSQTFECRLERGATVVSDWATCANPKTYDLSAEADGVYTFSVRGRDAAGNAGATASASYQLDRAAPAAPSISSAPPSPGSASSPSWGFSGEAGATLECRLERGATVVSDWATCTSPKTFDLSAQPDGGYTFRVRARDTAGNTGPATSSTYALDRSAPAAPSIGSPSSPGSDPTPSWSFTGEAGASFQCKLARGATVVADWAACSDPKTYDLSAEPDGNYSFSVRATDAAGNTGPAASSAYELDTGSPAAPSIDSSPASPDNDTTPAWSFSGETGASFECRLERGATTVSAWAACSDPKTFDLSAEPDGNYSFSVRATDAAGNTGPAAGGSYELDTAAPAAPSVSGPPSPGNDTTPTWSLSGEAGSSFECRLERGATTVSDWAACSDPKTYDLSSEPDGSYMFRVRATDAAANTSAPASSSYELDTVAPGAPSLSSSPPSPGNDPNPSWSFFGEAGASFECHLVRGATVISDWAACSDPKSYDLSSQPDGSYTFGVRARDAAGNTGAPTTSVYELDTAAAAPPSIDVAPSSPGNDPTPSWDFSSGEVGVTFECRLERGATIVSDWAACVGPATFDLSSEPDGGYSFSVRTKDGAGNLGPAASDGYVLDTQAPSVPSIGSAPPSPSNGNSPNWSFSGDAGASFECRLERGATVISDWASCSSPRSFDLSSEPDGSYSFSVRSGDQAGNTSAAASSSFQLDRNAPAAPSIDSAPASPGNDETPSWSFSGEAGASFECRLLRGATVVSDWSSCSDPKTYDLSSEPDGNYSFAVRARDAAGNTGPAAASGYALDTTAPAAPSIDAAATSPGADATPAWAFSGPGASFECRLVRGATVVSDWASCSSPRSFDLSSEPDGTYTFSVRASDSAGNTGAAASASYELDTAAPAAPSIDSSPASPGNGGSPSWSFSGEAGASFECRLERGAAVVSDWAACSSPRAHDLSSQVDGAYTFLVRASDAAVNTGPAASSSYTLDRGAPAAPSIDTSPASPGSDATPTWSFSAEAGAALECRLLRGATVVSDWAACSDPKTQDLSSEPDGLYSFSVRATDAAGNTGPAASSSYELDRSAPGAPSIDTAPPSPGNGTSPSWSFSAEAGAALECRVTRGAVVIEDWAACTSPKAADLSSEPDGTYTFAARATDSAGNMGPPASSTYDLDTAAPGTPVIDLSPASPGSTRSPAWDFSGEAGASFECSLTRGAAVVSGWTACSGPRIYDLLLEPEGTYTFAVRSRDAAGNTGAAASSDYELDTLAPGAPSIDSPPASPGNDSTPSWGFSGEAGATFECRLERGATTVSDWAACSDPETFDLSSEPDGSYSFSVRASDAAGNTSAAASSGYDLDATAPATPSIDTSPASPSSATTPSWAFSGEAGAALECRLERGASVVSDWAACASPQAYDLSSEPDGDYSFLVRATDAVGNSSAPATSGYTLDSSIPSVPTIDSTPGVVGSDASPAWGFSGDAGASFECRIDRGATPVSGWSACASPEAFDLSGEPDGDYTFSVRSLNGAGGASAPATSDYELDRSAPGAPTISSAPASPDNDVAPSWSFTGEAGASFECRLSNGATVVSDWTACSSPEGFDLSGQPDGSYRFEVRAIDAAGNTGAPSSSDYELDTSAPGQPSIDSAPASPDTATAPSWSFSGDPGAALECRLQRGGTTISDWSACSSPQAYDLSTEPDGSYSFSVRATDAAGNTGAAASSTYVLDRTGASVQIDAGPGAAGRDRSPQWAFSAEAGASFECRLERAGSTISAWAACSSPEAFDLGVEPDGIYNFSVRATDSLGNQGPPAGSDYELDTVVPGAPTITGQPASPSADSSPTWAFSAEAGASLQCRVEGGGALVSDWSDCSSPSSHDLSGRPDGRYELSVRATDAAGNTGPAASAGFDLDTTAPDAPDITAGPGRSGDDATPAWAFRGEQGASFECALAGAGGVVSASQACTSPQGYDLTSEPDGDYDLTVRARDAAGNLSGPASADYELDRNPGGSQADPGATAPRQPDRLLPAAGTRPPAPGFGSGAPSGSDEPSGGGQPSGGDEPSGGGPVGDAISGELGSLKDTAAKPDEDGSTVLKALGRAASAVARNADKSVFPVLLLAMVLSFFGIQNRIDRNDPKLGLAPIFADPDLEFGPPPTRL